MAVRGAAAVIALSLPVAVAVALYLGRDGLVSFGYGVFVGLVAFSSIGVTVSLVLGKTTQLRVLAGAGVYVGRVLFAAAAVLVPAFAGWLAVLPMVGGLVLVYVVESVVLLFEAQRFMKRSAPWEWAREREATDGRGVEVPVGEVGQVEQRRAS